MSVKGIVIDPGHGGADSGAVGNGIIEKNLTLDISKYMYDRFNEMGIPAKLTRTNDVELNSDDRPKKVLNQFGNGRDVIVISNHINAGGGEGAEVIYALRNNDRLSSKILSSLEGSGQVVRKYYQRRLPSDTSKDYYYIIRNTPNNETIIVEYGFLDNVNDANRLKNNYKKYAEAVIKAVCEYAGLNYVPPANSGYYVVKRGDTLWSIAKNYGLTVERLKTINNLSSNTLNIGDVLLVKDDNVPNDVTGYEYYTVVRGDTLYGIANRFGLTVNDLKNMNNLTSNTLSIGQKLIVGNTVSSNNYIVKSGDTLYSIAKNFGLTVDDLKNANGLINNNLSIGQNLIIPSESSSDNINTFTYTVVKGDTLYSIAKKYNTSVSDIKNINSLTSSVLSIGQKLIIPS